MDASPLVVVLTLLAAVPLHGIIRPAGHHGIGDAERARRLHQRRLERYAAVRASRTAVPDPGAERG